MRVACGLVLSLLALGLLTAPASAGVANAGLRRASHADPLAGMRWGHFTGGTDGVYPAYKAAHGRDHRLMAKIALRPLAFWFGDWFPDRFAGAVVRRYIANVTRHNPNVLAQVTVFRLNPWEFAACFDTPSARLQAGYRHWINNFASGIGSSRVALILQPDLPFALCAPTGVPLRLVAYAARRFTTLPHTTVYLDAGAAEWASPGQAAWLLERAGIRHVRGFELNATQFGSVGEDLGFGAQVEHQLAMAHIHRKHFVINTDQNGSPFLAGQYHGRYPNNPPVCRSRRQRICVSLGIPPTTHVASRRWHLSRKARRIAAAVRRCLPVDRTALAVRPGLALPALPSARGSRLFAVLR